MLQGVIDKLSYRHDGSWYDLGSPPQLSRNTQLYVKPWWLNSGSQAIKGRASVAIIHPDNTVQTLSALENQDQIAAPGLGYGVAFSQFQLSQFGSYKAQVKLEEVGYDDFTITGGEWVHTSTGYILGYGDVYYYSPRITVKNNGSIAGSYIVGCRWWRHSAPQTVYGPFIYDTNRFTLNPGAQLARVLYTYDSRYALELWNSYSGGGLTAQLFVVARAEPLLIHNDIWNLGA